DASGLIFLDWNEPTAEGILTGKIFEYLRSGRPILGIGGTASSVSSRLMIEAGVGFPLGKEVKKIINFLVENFLNGKNPPVSPQWDVIHRFNRESLAKKALDYMGKLVH
ncbi:unnamed protein product, partial [marine sediment metagenome]